MIPFIISFTGEFGNHWDSESDISGYFYLNANIKRDFQISISVPLIKELIKKQLLTGVL